MSVLCNEKHRSENFFFILPENTMKCNDYVKITVLQYMALNVKVNGGLGRTWRKDIVVQLWHYLPGSTGHRSEKKRGYLISWLTDV